MHDINNYYEVITLCWKYFKKFYENYDGGEALADVYKYEEHFKANKYGPRVYDFAMRMIRECWKEVGEIHDVKHSEHD